MKSKKLMLCILIAMVFSFGIGTTDVLADGMPAIQETMNEGTKDLNEVANIDEIAEIDSNIEDADNIEDVVDVEDTDEIEEDEVEEVEEEVEEVEEVEEEVEETAKAVKTKKVSTEVKTTTTKTVKTTRATKATTKKAVVKKYTSSELRLLSALIYAEAGNQSYKGKLAVGNIVLNRAKSSSFSHANSVKEVIYDKKWGIQFSVIKKGSNGTSPLTKALSIYDSRTSVSGAVKENMLECIKAAKAALNGDNNIGNYLNFNGSSKYLANKYSNHVIIGDHIFYNIK